MTSVNRADERHATAAVIEIQDGEVQFAPSTGDDLQRITDASCNEHDSAGAKERFTQHSIEIAIAGVEKNDPRFHRDPTLAFNWPSAVTTQETAASALIDSRLHPAVWPSGNSPPHRASPVRKCHPLDRCNTQVE